MQLHQANTLERIESAGDEGSSDVITQPATGEPWDFSNPNGDEILALLKPEGDRKRPIWLVASALVAGFASGWAGGFSWYGPANISALNPITQTETPAHRVAEKRLGGKIEGARKTTSTLGLRTPSGATQISAVGASVPVKPLAAASDGAQLSVEQADTTPTGSIAPKGPMTPAPETGPTTIEGWTVLDVRGGTAVLGGPDGVQMAKRGDTVPGIGRIDSIVRWGNRWIVATARGLIATQ
ncbi:hypothetical protein SAMN05443247_10131 [Bradyrhizobium erythrophlei]|jgi:hypothetical protein|nr:hypothetical protein SAMN05443247_10131 [Bradyrhizobium erythrophlei]